MKNEKNKKIILDQPSSDLDEKILQQAYAKLEKKSASNKLNWLSALTFSGIAVVLIISITRINKTSNLQSHVTMETEEVIHYYDDVELMLELGQLDKEELSSL